MPYFDQVPDDERESRLGEVNRYLIRFKSMKLLYNMDDLLWRHIEVQHGVVYIFDLGSLEECEGDIDIDVQIESF